jgi:two-component system, LuxR family, sensor kinase FixL
LLRGGEALREPVNLNTLIEEALHLMRGELITRRVCVTTDLDVRLSCINANRIQIQQVVLNLLINAYEALADNPPEDRQLQITTQLCSGGRSIEVTVKDNGCGIAADKLERVFQPFVTTKRQGLGLGLVICRWIAQAHRGRLWADTATRGAVLHLRLPAE